MLYVLVNNDYQFQSLQRHDSATLGGDEGIVLIVVPHAMAQVPDASGFRAVHEFRSPLGSGRLPSVLWRYRGLALQVARKLAPGPGDTLLFFTEVEWLNQIVVQHFRARGARVVMLEDGGFATYIPMSVAGSEPLSWRERCIQAAYRLVPGLAKSRLFKVNGQLFPRLPDSAIDAIGLYQDVPLHRDVAIHRVRKPARKPCEVQPGHVIFLNDRMYDHYQTAEVYLAGLRRLMSALTEGFATVHFKFHPREPEDWKLRVRDMLAREFPAVALIERPGTVEKMILDYRPEVLASYFSSALLNIEYQGIEPLYLYSLLDDLEGQPVFKIATRILTTWGYRFVSSVDQVRSGYCSGIAADDPPSSIELSQLLRPAGDAEGVGEAVQSPHSAPA